MKQLLSLAFALLPCLAWAQYPSNGNQKITLGEQTTADGLIWRGVAADTTLTAKSDTAAYFVLDTVNINLYTYKASATGRKWRQLGADTASIAYVNTYGTQTVNGAKTFSSTVTGARFDPTSSSATGTGMFLPSANILGFSINNNDILRINDGFLQVRSGGEIRYMNSANNDWGLIKFATGGLNLGFINIQNAGGVNSMFPITNNVTDLGRSSFFYKTAYINNLSVGITTPTARLHLAAGTATASTAPLKFTSQGANLLNPVEAGAVEFNGTNLLFTPSTTRHTVNHGLTGSATLNFPSTNAQLSADLTITVTGAADGDIVSLGVPNAAVNANTSYSAWVSAANTVTVRFNNYSSGTVDPASASFKVFVTK